MIQCSGPRHLHDRRKQFFLRKTLPRCSPPDLCASREVSARSVKAAGKHTAQQLVYTGNSPFGCLHWGGSKIKIASISNYNVWQHDAASATPRKQLIKSGADRIRKIRSARRVRERRGRRYKTAAPIVRDICVGEYCVTSLLVNW